MTKPDPRILSPYEKNHLRKYDISEETALQTEKPVEYLTHHVDFCGLDFYVDESVLIPRIETEELVVLAVQTAQKIFDKTKRKLEIIDVGTGSGAITSCVSKKLLELQVPFRITATEISPEALQVAKKNVKKLVPKAEVQFVESNLLEGITQKFDLIIANLPYIPTERIAFLDKSVKDFEPRVALDGGKSGLTLIHTMIDQAKNVVYPHSKILLEVDYTHGYDEFNPVRADWNIVVTPDSNVGVHFVELQKK
ncbi:MAG: hypothetical protein BroJett025_07230 [Patescibacteria group bacterium]|nr:MAG: hypothetical protein BroJett025_07230 [Patescibacteria group bacterium]